MHVRVHVGQLTLLLFAAVHNQPTDAVIPVYIRRQEFTQ
jgi:hypothetical protein